MGQAFFAGLTALCYVAEDLADPFQEDEMLALAFIGAAFAATAFIMTQLTMLCSRVYLHCYLTHRSVRLSPGLALAMHAWLVLFTGIRARHWVAVHRKHHRQSDTADDPHSPRILGFWTVLVGTALLYYRAADPATLQRYTPVYRGDLVDRIPLVGQRGLGGLVILVAASFCLGFGWAPGLLLGLAHWLGCLVLFGLQNSAGHYYGEQAYPGNQATNCHWLAWLTMGETLQNNHHHDEGAARFGRFDPGWWCIQAFCRLGLARVRREAVI